MSETKIQYAVVVAGKEILRRDNESDAVCRAKMWRNSINSNVNDITVNKITTITESIDF